MEKGGKKMQKLLDQLSGLACQLKAAYLKSIGKEDLIRLLYPVSVIRHAGRQKRRLGAATGSPPESKENNTVRIHRNNLDFSLDSRIRESLLDEIKARYLRSGDRLDDDDLLHVNAAGDLSELNPPPTEHPFQEETEK